MRRSVRLLLAVLAPALLIASGVPQPAVASFEVTKTECKESGTSVPTVCIEQSGKMFEAKGEETYVANLVKRTHLTFRVPVTIEIECGKDRSEGKLFQTSPGTTAVAGEGVLHLEECAITGPAADVQNCSIPASKESTELVGEVVNEMPLDAGIAKPKAGTSSPFIEVPFSNKGTHTCVLKGTKKVTGEDKCFSSEAEVAATVHLGECTKGAFGLKFGEETAELESKSEGEFSGASKSLKSALRLA
jgi:hypothetical protein